jgi:DNA adenine methylase
MKPVLKWVGGKKKILPLIEDKIKKINIKKDTVFHDVFCGGLSVSILASKYFNKVNSNDINSELINVYKSIKENHNGLISYLKKFNSKHSELFYYRTRKEKFYDKEKSAARTIYLNKTCYNGMYRVNSDDEFNVPIGKYSNPKILDEINLVELNRAFKKKFSFSEFNYEKAIVKAKKGDLVYLDPPYYKEKKDSFTEYNSEKFSDSDHEKLSETLELLTKSGIYFIFSNSNTEKTRLLFSRYLNNQSVIPVRRLLGPSKSRHQKTELLFDNIDIVNYENKSNNK